MRELLFDENAVAKKRDDQRPSLLYIICDYN